VYFSFLLLCFSCFCAAIRRNKEWWLLHFHGTFSVNAEEETFWIDWKKPFSDRFSCDLAKYRNILKKMPADIDWGHLSWTSSVATGFGRHGMSPPICNPNFWTFDLETGVQVSSKLGNRHSKFGNARPLGSRIIRYVHDGQTDRRTDKSNSYCPFPKVRGLLMKTIHYWLAKFNSVYWNDWKVLGNKVEYLVVWLHTLNTRLTLHALPVITLDDWNHFLCQI